MNFIMFRVFLLIVIHFGFLDKVVDVKQAFLCRKLEEEIYMESSLAMNDAGKNDCIILEKCIYGLV